MSNMLCQGLNIGRRFVMRAHTRLAFTETHTAPCPTSLMHNAYLGRVLSVRMMSSRTGKGSFKPMSLLLLLVPVGTFCLGTWQVQRRKWKLNLIAELKAKTTTPPINLPQELSELEDLEYQQVKLIGSFDHSKEVFVGPRSLLVSGDVHEAGSGLISSGQSGYLVITPFKLIDRNLTILINRGWVSRNQTNPESRFEGQVEGPVELTALVRKSENRAPFMPKNMMGSTVFTYRDVPAMAKQLGTAPVFLDAVDTTPGGPRGGQTRVTMRNEHLSYILTWCGRAGVSMSSTLPRTRSVSAASSSSSAASASKERVRPVSVCDASWLAKMSAGEERQQARLVRTPSQANTLATTVPQSLVVKNLGGRHTPTRSSLRHSRMLVLAKNGYPVRGRRWPTGGVGRVGVLVVTAQVLVGVMGVTLAAWFLVWAPSLKFREVPHYAGVPVLLAGVLGAVWMASWRRRRPASLACVLKGVLVALCCVSVVTCLCVCIFTALHLTQLAAMTCHPRHAALPRPLPNAHYHHAPLPATQHSLTTQIPLKELPRHHLSGGEDDEDEAEGSGREPRDLPVSHPPDEGQPFPTARAEDVLNVTFCECVKSGPTWVRMLRYPKLSCLEVNNMLPVLLVASCVVTGLGALLSGLLLYLLWSFTSSFFGPAKPYETRPFIFTSHLKGNIKASNGSSPRETNGDSEFS
ncbi:uncharacterized protein [Procambarus clarkii]|uniref:uncharacterized protein isoform X1 n=1 Tax=Procambarus clarkii TaxID=6728 RepID=UPI001E673072|nr:uncharacterized protein LOC123753935 isoform X2 [Procambarus clarkii]